MMGYSAAIKMIVQKTFYDINNVQDILDDKSSL